MEGHGGISVVRKTEQKCDNLISQESASSRRSDIRLALHAGNKPSACRKRPFSIHVSQQDKICKWKRVMRPCFIHLFKMKHNFSGPASCAPSPTTRPQETQSSPPLSHSLSLQYSRWILWGL